MRTISDKDLPLKEETAIAVGMFDGFHAGHRALIDDINKQDMGSMVFTFDTKPAAHYLIYTPYEKRMLAQSLGVTYYYEKSFDDAFAELSPKHFVELLVNQFGMRHLTVGFDFRFGKDAAGNTDLLKELSEEYGFSLRVIPEKSIDGYKVSSSNIRKLVLEGEMREVARLLGRFFSMDGEIESGRQLGSKMGFPTANLSTDKIMPAFGVYATVTVVQDKHYFSVTNVGIKPTVKSDSIPNVETFILNYSGNLYGDHIRVCFVEKIRDEMKFPDVGALQLQIEKDSATAEKILQNTRLGGML